MSKKIIWSIIALIFFAIPQMSPWDKDVVFGMDDQEKKGPPPTTLNFSNNRTTTQPQGNLRDNENTRHAVSGPRIARDYDAEEIFYAKRYCFTCVLGGLVGCGCGGPVGCFFGSIVGVVSNFACPRICDKIPDVTYDTTGEWSELLKQF